MLKDIAQVEKVFSFGFSVFSLERSQIRREFSDFNAGAGQSSEN
jgi:hypothetical protein